MKYFKIKYPFSIYVSTEHPGVDVEKHREFLNAVTDKVIDYIENELKGLGLTDGIDFIIDYAYVPDTWYKVDVLIEEKEVDEKVIKEVLYVVWKADELWKDLAHSFFRKEEEQKNDRTVEV